MPLVPSMPTIIHLHKSFKVSFAWPWIYTSMDRLIFIENDDHNIRSNSNDSPMIHVEHKRRFHIAPRGRITGSQQSVVIYPKMNWWWHQQEWNEKNCWYIRELAHYFFIIQPMMFTWNQDKKNLPPISCRNSVAPLHVRIP